MTYSLPKLSLSDFGQIKIFTLIMKRFLMKNPDNEAWIKSQEKVHEATLVSQARSKLLRNSMYPELSVAKAHVAIQSQKMADLTEQFWWKGLRIFWIDRSEQLEWTRGKYWIIIFRFSRTE